MQPKKQCISERDEQLLAIRPPLSDENDEILWCELLDRGESVIEEWNGVGDDHQDVATKQLVQGVAGKGNERGANVHEKSMIWAAKDTEWKKLEEKGAVCILSGDSAEKAKTQFANRFIPSRFVVTRPNPEEFKARWCLRRYLDPEVMELVKSGSTQSPTVSQVGTNAVLSDDCEQWLESAAGRHSRCLLGGNQDRCTRVFLPEEFHECQMEQSLSFLGTSMDRTMRLNAGGRNLMPS